MFTDATALLKKELFASLPDCFSCSTAKTIFVFLCFFAAIFFVIALNSCFLKKRTELCKVLDKISSIDLASASSGAYVPDLPSCEYSVKFELLKSKIRGNICISRKLFVLLEIGAIARVEYRVKRLSRHICFDKIIRK